jgi:MoaA/NifB/PqqE/SkfB family radical SAM enzyme
MITDWLADGPKKARFIRSFAAHRLVHTNLQILYACNFRCRICDFWQPEHQQRPRLTAAQVAVISRKLAQVGPQIVSIGGGEPLLHEELLPIVRTLARDHFPVMISNGWCITPALARELFAAGLYEVSVSVDYADRERHDAQRGREGAFDRALDALRALDRARVHRWQRVHMISVVMEDNVDEIEPLLQLCARMGVTYLVTLHSTCRGRLERCAPATMSDLGGHLLRLKQRYPQFVQVRGYLRRFSEAMREGGVAPCYAGRNLCNIDSQGSVTLCIDRLDEPVGNILHDAMPAIEERLLGRHRVNDCRSCWTSCRGCVETLMYGDERWSNLGDYVEMTRPLPLT